MTQEQFSGEVSHTSVMIYQLHPLSFQTNPGNSTNFRAYLISQRRALYKNLYKERMSEIYAWTLAFDKRHVTGILLSGSAKKLTSMGDYIGMPTALNSPDRDMLVTAPETVKTVTKNYWSKLYTQQDTPDVPKPWLSTSSITAVRNQVETDPFQWPVPSNIADFRTML
jgi:hypothetical protein